MPHKLLGTAQTMRSRRALLVWTIRLAGVFLVAFASLELSLGVAHGAFLLRQGRGRAEALPLVIAWLGVVVVGLGLYARGERLGDRLMGVLRAHRGAI